MAFPSFILPANGQATPASIARRRQLANALMQQGLDASPVASPWQAIARAAQGLVGGLDERAANKQEQTGISSANQALAAALQGKDPNAMAMAFNNPYVTPEAASMASNQYARANPTPLEQLRLQTGQAELDQLQHPTMTPYQQAEVAAEKQRLDLARTGSAPQPQPGFIWGPKDANGNVTETPIQGGPQDPNRQVPVRNLRPTTDQSNAAGFYDRMTQADQILSDPAIAGEGMSLTEKTLSRAPLGVGNYLVNDNYQKYDQASRNFVNAVLRKESGAAISEGEFENARRQYFPQPGDSKEVLNQKAQNRATAINAMHRSAGPALQVHPEAGDQSVPPPDTEATMQSARDAIAAGADPEAVKQRLIDNSIDPSGL